MGLGPALARAAAGNGRRRDSILYYPVAHETQTEPRQYCPGAGAERIDNKILHARMPPWIPDLGNFDRASECDECERLEQVSRGIPQAERETGGKKCCKMFEVVRRLGNRPVRGGNQRQDDDSARKYPGNRPQKPINHLHLDVLAPASASLHQVRLDWKSKTSCERGR
jgi:hypothetical protein